jgi:hypothetical protein
VVAGRNPLPLGRGGCQLVWFIQKGIPLNLEHLKQRIQHIGDVEICDRQKFFDTLREKIHSIDWQLAQKDVRSFIADPRSIESWSSQFFLDLIEHLKIESCE